MDYMKKVALEFGIVKKLIYLCSVRLEIPFTSDKRFF